MRVKIYFSEDTELAELESAMKEYRGDVLIEVEGNCYLLEFITPHRLLQEYQILVEGGYVCTVDNTILMEHISKQSIIDAVVKLYEMNYFVNRQTSDLTKVYRSAFQELQDIANWKRVY